MKSWKKFYANSQPYEELTVKLITNQKWLKYIYICICYYILRQIFVEFSEETWLSNIHLVYIKFWRKVIKALILLNRSSSPEVFWRIGAIKQCSWFTGKHPRRSLISIKLLCSYIEIALRHGYSLVNLLFFLRTRFVKNSSGAASVLILCSSSIW